MKKVIIATLLFTMLHSCMGCSDSQNDMESVFVPQEEYMASDMVIYEANPRIFAEENAFSAIKADLGRIQSLGTPCELSMCFSCWKRLGHFYFSDGRKLSVYK